MKTLSGSGQADGGDIHCVIQFLKEPSRWPFVPRVTLGENLDPLDRAMAVLRCCIFLEGTALESMVC